MTDPADATTRKRASAAAAEPAPFHVFRLFSPGGVAGDSEPLLLTPGSTPVGRAPSRGLSSPDDAQMSRSHATLLYEAGADVVHLVDQSTNGTSVNGSTTREAVLRDGDVVRTGDSLWLLRRARLGRDAVVPGMLGRSPAMREVRATLALLARTQATALLVGESGVGKEVAARAIHALSGRPGPLVAVNASAIPETLAESELFGHVAGAFTGARSGHAGMLRRAHGGTFVLDEVGDLPLAIQPKLLRVLEDRMVRPLGGGDDQAIDVRMIAATNQDLEQRVADGRFRGDLFSRLAEITVRLPALRERREDILLLFVHLLGRAQPRLAPDLAEALVLHDWPYNVRELAKVAVEVSVRGGDDEPFGLDLVAGRLTRHTSHPSTPPVVSAPAPPAPRPAAAAPRVSAQPTRDELIELLRRHRGELAAIARERGRSRKQVYRWLEHYDLDADSFRKPPDGE